MLVYTLTKRGKRQIVTVDKGVRGPSGPQGDAATIEVGDVTSGPVPEVVNRGTSSEAILDFILPDKDPEVISAGYIDSLFN